jgi:hypothetical protein
MRGNVRRRGATLYLYEDVNLAAEEEMTLYQLLEEEIDRETLNQRLKRVGMMLVVSSLKTEPRQVYGLCKSRNLVEKHNACVQEPDPGGLTLSLGFNSDLRPRLCRVLLSLPLLQDREPDQESGDDRSSLAARAAPETLKGLCSGKQGEESVLTGVPEQV